MKSLRLHNPSGVHIYRMSGFQVRKENQSLLFLGRKSFHADICLNAATVALKGTTIEKTEWGILDIEDERWFQIDINAYGFRLQRCASVKGLPEGMRIHAHLTKFGLTSDTFLGNNLVNMYVKCGMVLDARQVFDKMSTRNVLSWNMMIAGYAKRGSIENARQLFDTIPRRDVVSWNAMIAGYTQLGHAEDALIFFCQMQRAGILPNRITLVAVLGVCAGLGGLDQGKQVHSYIIRAGFASNVFVVSALVGLYAKCNAIDDSIQAFEEMPEQNVVVCNTMIAGYFKSGKVECARHLFDKMPERDIVSWNAIIAGYAQHGQGDEAGKIFCQMQRVGLHPDECTFASMLSACASLAAVAEGKQVHADIIRRGYGLSIFVGSALIDMYGKCGMVQDARQIFDRMRARNVVSWTAMITGYAQNARGKDALQLFSQLQQLGTKLDEFTSASVLSACASLAALQQGKQLHAYFIRIGLESDVSVGNALLTMYAKCDCIRDARHVFDNMSERDIVTWNAMILGYAQDGRDEEALKVFLRMRNTAIKVDQFTLVSVLSACDTLFLLGQSRQVHAHIIKIGYESWVHVANALVTMYSKCRSTGDARHVFDHISERYPISWNLMIAGYTQNGYGEEALNLFYKMQQTGTEPDHFTFASVLSSCACISALSRGKQIHASIIRTGFESYVPVGNALVNMYAKCGSIEDAHQVFLRMPDQDAVSWNAMISGFAQHGHGLVALQLFEHMLEGGTKPDHITFIAVLSACSHAGLVDEGYHYFDSMNRNHCISPTEDHYACMVDLLGRAGRLDVAENFIKTMPFKPDATVWGALLSACRIHGNMKLGLLAAECLIELEPQNEGCYVLLSNIYAAAGKWNDAMKVRNLMKDKGVKKNPGCSWIEVKNRVHQFVAGDKSHLQTDEIYATLERLAGQMEGAGYVPDTNFVLHDIEEQHKKHILGHHSEKLAIAFRLISTSHEMPI